jgi:hypothetical protein
MPTIGAIAYNLHTVDRDETVYSTANHSVSHVDALALRRTLPSKSNLNMRTNARFEQGFAAGEEGEKSVTVSIAVTVPPGIDLAAAKTYISGRLTDAADVAADLATTGDIHLS